MQDIQGYVEWHLSVVISTVVIRRGVTSADWVAISMVIMAMTWLLKKTGRICGNFDTLYNVAALMVARSFSTSIMQYITDIGGMDDIVVIIAIITIATAIVHVFKLGTNH